MMFTIILFFASIAAAAGLIIRRVWQLRKADIVIDPSYEQSEWTEVSVEGVRMRLIEIVKLAVHYSALGILKSWILARYFIKRIDAWVHKKLMQVLHKNAHRPIPSDVKPSSFMQDMTAHKEEVAREMGKEAGE